MRIIDRYPNPQVPRTLCAALGIAFVLSCGAWSRAHAAPVRYSFAVLADTLQGNADEAPTQRLLDTIGRERNISFIVYDGNLRGPKEACRDSLYEQRQAILEAARPALIFIPGQYDWTDCGSPEAGGFDPVERLDQLRQTVFADSASMGQNPLALTRESEVSRFRQYRENVRWQLGDTVFIGLNVPGTNNHYLTAGGRNGEFEDRVIANAFWLEHAAEYAKRREARAIVVFIQGDPDPERYERPDRFAWLRFGRNSRRDGFLELKRTLVKVAQQFHGPVLLIHCDDERSARGFVIDQPLRNDKGEVVTNLTRIAFAPRDRLDQWIQIDADLSRRPPFRVSVREVPKNVPLLPVRPPQPAAPEAASEEDMVPTAPPTPEPDQAPGANPSMNPSGNPAVSPSMNPASNLPPLLPVAPPASTSPSAQPSYQQGPQAQPDSSTPASTGVPAGSVQRGP
ncbi:hypothetical protein [Paraburkholderia sp. DHOC27]|uniref:hypothetical protein n=1 Tax=Paraburkholderia sp. DHOC27 TaxID=2303330 RepID=UPI000E3E0EE1|nr:hypothetical protein [Paraburkholderia sp. DHOC27]RFU45708.1 hypothetical protein D0B32_23495 [Paraburkholderia sp. DHOC27]